MPSKPSLWLRFVDDVLAIVKCRALQVTLETLNEQHDDITFTMEVEENGQPPYLDARIARKDNQPFIKQQLSRLRKKQETPERSKIPDGQAQDDPKSVYSTTIVVPVLDGITQAIQMVLRPLEIRVVGRPQRWDWSLQRAGLSRAMRSEPCIGSIAWIVTTFTSARPGFGV